MQLLDLSLAEPQPNLALDEALLEVADSIEGFELLRLWQFEQPAVIVGRATKVRDEVDREFCESQSIPILRRCSGGTSVTVGPGCLMYSLTLNTSKRPELKNLDQVHKFVMLSIRDALSSALEVEFQGTCDLTWRNRKFSGNSVRISRQAVLYHGTLLFDFPLELIHQTLESPPRQPDYRRGRSHDDFVTNLPITESELRAALCNAFGASERLLDWPEARTIELTEQRYSQTEWNYRH